MSMLNLYINRAGRGLPRHDRTRLESARGELRRFFRWEDRLNRTVRQVSGEDKDMAQCEVCGNDYDKAFEVVAAGARHVFDSFECAIHKLAPVCEHCGCRVVGHGIEAAGHFYCCAHCARSAGVQDVRDRAGERAA